MYDVRPPRRSGALRGIGRRAFLARAAALGLGARARELVPGAAAWAAGETTAKRDLVDLQASDITALDPHAGLITSELTPKARAVAAMARAE
jgi:hypothetical protein